jgi:hypothetical protein
MPPTITATITGRMAAAKKARTGHLKDLVDIGRRAARRHDEVAAGKGKIKPESREAALDALQATGQFCKSLLEEQQPGKTMLEEQRQRHSVREYAGKFAKRGSFGHMQRMVAGKQ